MAHGGVTHEVGKHPFAVSDPSPPRDAQEGSGEGRPGRGPFRSRSRRSAARRSIALDLPIGR
jgi:hypothetical protein